MKQIIVMVAMVALGILIAGIVTGFGASAEQLADEAKGRIATVGIFAPEEGL